MVTPLPTPTVDAPADAPELVARAAEPPAAGALGALLAALPDVVLVLDRDGVCQRVVPTARGRCGPPPAAAVGRGPHASFPAALADQMLATVRRALDEQRPVELSYALDLPYCQGWFVGTASPLGDGTVLWVARDVTAGRAADAARDASEARLRSALEASLNATFLLEVVRDPDGRVVDFTFTEANTACERLYGLGPGALCGRRLCEVFPGVRDSAVLAHYVRVVETGVPFQSEYRTRDPRARAAWLWLQAVPLRGPDGLVLGLAARASDITARKRAEAEQQLGHEVTAALSTAPDVAGALGAALRAMCAGTALVLGEAWVPVTTAEATGAPWAPASHFLAPGAPAPHLLPPGTLVRGPAWHAPDDAALARFGEASRAYTFAPGVGLPGRVAAEGAPVLLADLGAMDDAFVRGAHARDTGLRGALAVPLVADGAVVAVLAFYARQADALDAELLDRLAAVAARIGMVVRRRQMEEELARERSFLAAVLESLSEGIVLKSADGRFTWFNRATREFHNAPPVSPGVPDVWEGPRGHLYRPDGVTPLGPEELPLYRALLEQGHVADVELVIAPPGGRRRTMLINARAIRGPDGALLGAVSAARDMTEERRLAAERERLLRALAEQAEQDELTALLNRRGFLRMATQERRSAARTGRADGVCYVDLDRFKPINDRYGHAAGDDALRAVAGVLRATIRDADFAGRLGGDEFAIYAVGLTRPAEVHVLAARLHAALTAHNGRAAAGGRPYEIGFSVGAVALAPEEALDAGLARADSALYAAKPRRRDLAGAAHA